MSDRPSFEIDLGMTAAQSSIRMNGAELPGVTSITISASASGLTNVTLRIHPSSVKLSGTPDQLETVLNAGRQLDLQIIEEALRRKQLHLDEDYQIAERVDSLGKGLWGEAWKVASWEKGEPFLEGSE